MSGTDREEEVDQNDFEFLGNAAGPNSNVFSYIEITPVNRNYSRWPLLLAGFISGVVITLAFQNYENHRGWRFVLVCSGFVGVHFLGRYLRGIFRNPFNRRSEEILEHPPFFPFHFPQPPTTDNGPQIFEIIESDQESPTCSVVLPSTTDQIESFPPSPAVSDASSDVLTVARADYRPNSTDLSFRQRQQDRTQKYKKFVQKQWISAPSIMVQKQMSCDASLSEEKVEESVVEAEVGGESEVEDRVDEEKEKSV